MIPARILALGLGLILSCGVGLQAGTKLSRAAVDGDLTQMETVLTEDGEKVTDLDKWGWTALHWAAYYGHPKAATWLLERGADPNVKTAKVYGNFLAGTTPLILAAYYGHNEIVADLLKKGAVPGEKDSTGMTALEYARKWNFEKVVVLLEGK